VFSHTVRSRIESLLSHAPHLSARAVHALASGVSQGNGARAGLAHLPGPVRGLAAHAVRVGFVAGLNELFLIGAILTLVSSVLTLLLIRSRDFEVGAARGARVTEEGGAPTAAPA
jgi:hypothetical protein